LNTEGSLADRAQALNERYFDGKLKFEIKYVTNQNSKFGSCTPANKMIRISDRLADIPGWVRDYVIVHELAHLVHPNHSRRFWDLVNHYRYTERARGYLMAIGMNDDEEASF
jgi:Predicted metal-dependent hydrolase